MEAEAELPANELLSLSWIHQNFITNPATDQSPEAEKEDHVIIPPDPRHPAKIYGDGDVYEGDYVNGLREGQGSCAYADGRLQYSWERSEDVLLMMGIH